jgi:hypothetical protein
MRATCEESANCKEYLEIHMATYDHAVKIEEEHDEMESKLEERFLLVDIELSEDLRSIKKMSVVEDLLCIECKEWQVEKKSYPVPIDQEHERKEGMDSCFRDNVGIQTVAKIDGVDIVAIDNVSKRS